MTHEDVESLFRAACDLPPGERESWVRAETVTSAVRDEVLSLLDHHARLEADANFLATPLARIDRDELDDLQRGGEAMHQVPSIEGFEILELLGRGGMGVVYRAAQKHPQRFVALKVVDSVHADPELSRRLRREAESLGRLEHPGIARLYQAGVTSEEDGRRPWLAMELVQGLPLLEFASRQRLSRRERVELLARVADAVHYAHGRGVIHRDLKPANVLVIEEPSASHNESSVEFLRGGQPKILDFGVARLSGTGDVSQATQPGRIVGTLAWMSPEQCNAGSEVDERSDVFALGVLLHELLSGRRPHDLAGLSLPVALRTIQEVQAAPLSAIDARLRGDLETIVGKALQIDPRRRYGSAAELAADLRRHLRDEPISARPATWFDSGSKFVRRHRSLAASTTAIFLVLGASLIVVAREASSARDAEQDARASAEQARQAELRATDERDLAREAALDLQSSLDYVAEMLLRSDPYRHTTIDLTVAERLTEAAAQLEERNDLRPRVRAHTCLSLGQAFHARRDYPQAVRWFDEARELFAELDGVDSLGFRRTHLLLAQTHADRGDAALAREALELAVADEVPLPSEDPLLHFRLARVRVRLAHLEFDFEAAIEGARALLAEGRAHGLPESTLEPTRNDLVRILMDAGENEEAYELAEELSRERDARFGTGHAASVGARGRWLEAADKLGRIEESVTLARQVLPDLSALGPGHPDHLVFLEVAARALRNGGHQGEAEIALEQALELSGEQFGERHARTLGLRHSRALLWISSGRDEARAELEELLPLCDEVVGPSPLRAAVASSLGILLSRAGEHERGIDLQRSSVAWFSETLGDDHESTLGGRSNLAGALLTAGRAEEALPHLTDLVERLRTTQGRDHPATLNTSNTLAVALKRLKRFAEAESLFADLAAANDRAFPPQHTQRGVSRLTWALCLLEMERYEDAEPKLRESLTIFDANLSKGHPYRVKTLEALIELCERTNREAEAETYGQRLAAE